MDHSVFFGWKEVESIYQSLKTNNLGIGLYMVSISIALIIIVSKGAKNFSNIRDSSTGIIDMKSFMDTIMPYIYGLMIVIAIPVIISTVEAGLSYIENITMSNIGFKHPKSIAEALEKELEEKMINGGIDIVLNPQNAIAHAFDMFGILTLKPLLAMLDQYLFAGALTIRYLYLLGLELVAPIAVVGLIAKETENWFYTWAKNMLACYLMIPIFLIALAFAEGLKQFLITEHGITSMALILVCFLKFSLFKFSATLVFKLI
jgi:hypothetical protein